VKTNIGHLEAAAGMAGLLKLVGCFQERAMYGLATFKRPSPSIAWGSLPVTPLAQTQTWETPPAAQGRYYAGLSSFGIGGANAHLALAGPDPEALHPVSEGLPAVLVFSAFDQAGLLQYLAEIVAWWEAHQQIARQRYALQEWAYTLSVRPALSERWACVAHTWEEWAEKTRSWLLGRPQPECFQGHFELGQKNRRFWLTCKQSFLPNRPSVLEAAEAWCAGHYNPDLVSPPATKKRLVLCDVWPFRRRSLSMQAKEEYANLAVAKFE
jgi:acyl transferase domain-containing protein